MVFFNDVNKLQLIQIFKKGPIIKKDAFKRGYYITANNSVNCYLYEDGEIKSGVSGHNEQITSFWKRKKDAISFYKKWKNGEINETR